MKVFSRRWMPYTVFIAVLLVILFLPVRFPGKIESAGKVLSANEWHVTRAQDGRLASILIDNISGTTLNYTLSQFERGDAVSFEFNNNLKSGSPVSLNDTLAVIRSNETSRQLIQLRGELTTARASLNLYLTGDKLPVIEEEMSRLQYAKTYASEQKKLFSRIKSLYEKNLVSQEEYDLAKNTYDLSEINVAISEARVQSVSTGAKKEQIGLIKAQIRSLENELEILNNRADKFVLVSPVNGTLSRFYGGDTLFSVSDRSRLIVIIPVEAKDLKSLTPGQVIKLRDINGITKYGELAEIQQEIQILNGKQYVVVTGRITEDMQGLMPGMITQCSITTGHFTVRDFVLKFFESLLKTL